MKKRTKIGVFDSGIGGFSILREIMATVPGIEIDYISDDEFAPYGSRTDEEIIERSDLIAGHLLEREAALVVVACNSATAAAIAELRRIHADTLFVGVEPYINILNHGNQFPGISKAAVITTVLTGNSSKFNRLREKIDPRGIIRHISMPELASITEHILAEGLTDPLLQLLREELSPLKELDLSHLILGCTHYPLISRLIQEELNVQTVSAAPHVARRVKSLVHCSGETLPEEFSFLSTSYMKWEKRNIAALDHLLRYSCSGGKR